jgi:4-amino-4-deoxy-L-arabinose transferase-like glycosyltransferase
MKQRNLIIIMALAIATVFANIGGLDIYALDEAKNAEAAREMFLSGDYVVPYFNGELRTDKPPLHYYFMNIGYSIFGVNAFGARFMNAVFGVLTVLLVFLFARKHFNEKVALFSSLVLITSLHFNLQMHMSVPDPYLIFFLTWAFFSFFNAYKENKWPQKVAFYFAIGCGLLLKGPIAVGLTGLTALLFLILQKDLKWKTIWRLQPFGGLLLTFAVALPWYWAVHQVTDGAWTDEFFFKHNFSRFSDPMEGHKGIFLLTFAYAFLLGMLTFIPFIPQALKQGLKGDAGLKYLLIGVSVIVVFFAISSTKLPNYTTPSYPLMAILIGYFISKVKDHFFVRKSNLILYYFYAFLMIGLPFGIYFGLKADQSISHLAGLWVYFIPTGLMGVYWVYTGIRKQNLLRAIQINMMVWLATILMFFYLAFPQVDAENPTRKLIPQMQQGLPVIAYKQFNSAFVFEMQQIIPYYKEANQIEALIREQSSGYIISRKRYQEELEQIEGVTFVDEARDTFENPTSLLMYWERD